MKKQQRKLLRERIQKADLMTRAESSAKICRRLLALPEIKAADTILSYFATDSEVNLLPLHDALLNAGKTLAFPRMTSGSEMEAYVPQSIDAGLLQGPFGIREPDPKNATHLLPEDIDLILLPCLGFDKTGRRLGHGKGYYDRYLARCRSDVKKVLVAFSFQELPEVAADENDIPAAIVIAD